MIIILKKGADASQVEGLKNLLRARNITPQVSEGSIQTIIGCVGDVSHVDPSILEALDVVESVQRIQEPYKAANRKFHPDDSVIDCGGPKIGGGNFQVIAGPCSVESEEQVIGIAKAVKAAGATLLRGGAFKPRTSPYSFQGLGKKGLEILSVAKRETGLPIVTELMGPEQLEFFDDVQRLDEVDVEVGDVADTPDEGDLRAYGDVRLDAMRTQPGEEVVDLPLFGAVLDLDDHGFSPFSQ